MVQLVDLATGVCTPRLALLHTHRLSAAARMPDARIVCAGGIVVNGAVQSTAEMWGLPEQGAVDAAWTWRALPAMGVGRYVCYRCVMRDGCFAVLGGWGIGIKHGPAQSHFSFRPSPVWCRQFT